MMRKINDDRRARRGGRWRRRARSDGADQAAGPGARRGYRGTLVCAKLPFTEFAMREAIAVTIAGGDGDLHACGAAARDTRSPARRRAPPRWTAHGSSLQGDWKGDAGQYRPTTSGSFVRRSAKLIGTQTWTDGGRIVTRKCSGVIKRPLKAFLPRNRKPASSDAARPWIRSL